MNRWVKSILITSFLIGIFVFVFFNKIYDPFPVKAVSNSEVINKVNKADGQIVKINSNELGYQWYVSESNKANDNLINLMKDKGWSFIKKKEHLYFFEGKQGNIIVKSEVWKEKYIVFRFPEGI